MNDENKFAGEEEVIEIITLEDEDGKEIDFELIGEYEDNGTVYYAVTPAGVQDENEGIIEYTLLKLVTDENGDEMYVSVDDEDEFDKIAGIFDDMFDSEEDYDA
jgi:uncharacterized protein YrzB (UPF0473 family)